MTEITTDCRTDAGTAVALVDGFITQARVLRAHYAEVMESPEVQETLLDMAADEDVRWLMANAADALRAARQKAGR